MDQPCLASTLSRPLVNNSFSAGARVGIPASPHFATPPKTPASLGEQPYFPVRSDQH